MSWRYANIILDSSLYKCSRVLPPSSQQSILLHAVSERYFQSSIFNSKKEFTNDTWIVEPYKEFIAQFIYLTFCGQMSHWDHFSHIVNHLWFTLTRIVEPNFCVRKILSGEVSCNLVLSVYFQHLSFFQHQSLFKNLCSYMLIYQWRKLLLNAK